MPISPQELIFYSFSAVIVLAALTVILVRNPVHAVLALILSFFSMSAIWLLLGAEFLGIALVLVYVGAVMVLFIFVVMMLDINVATLRAGYTRYAPLGLLVAVTVLLEIGYVVWSKQLGIEMINAPAAVAADVSNTRLLGEQLYTTYVFPFEIAALILLVGIVAAIVLTMRRRPNTRSQDTSWQVSTRAEDRLRMMSVKSEKKRTRRKRSIKSGELE